MKKLIYSIKKTILKITSGFFYFYSRTIRTRKIILFESYPDLSDNTFVLYNQCIKEGINDEYQLIWLVDDATTHHTTLPNVSFVSIKGEGFIDKFVKEIIRNTLLARCEVYFFSNRPLTRTSPKNNQQFVYLTHGIGLKYWKNNAFSSNLFSKIVVSSDYAAELIAHNFDDIDSKLLYTGYPRNELLAYNEKTMASIEQALDIPANAKAILWLPTYRRHASGFNNLTNTNNDGSDWPIVKNNHDWLRINDHLIEQNAMMILKPHPAQDMSTINLLDLSRIRIINDDLLSDYQIQLYELLSVTDLLITDYSSVYFDYLLLDKPIAFSIDDYESYQRNVGFVLDDALELMPGRKMKTMNDLVSVLDTLEDDEYKTERTILKNKLHTVENLNYSKNILEILHLIKKEANNEEN